MSEASNSRQVAVRFDKVARYFGTVRAVDDVFMEVYDKEFFSMLGPSGSGKTTCLRLIAGFEQPSSGSIKLYGQEVAGIPPYDRVVNTVFQDYALFPHMKVAENVGYGLMVKGVPKTERNKRVEEMLDLVHLSGMGKRKPSELSGGQRQRVALARALINHPRVLLLDEPLGALDLKLRQAMQIELKNIQSQVGITFIYVTHDQEEALTMSDRIAVFNHGKIEQVGTPTEIYEAPKTAFVAGFVGTSNVFPAEVAAKICDKQQSFAIRPEKIQLVPTGESHGSDKVHVSGQLTDITYMGMYTRFILSSNVGQDVIVVEQNLDTNPHKTRFSLGDTVQAVWSKNNNRYLSD